MHESPGYSKFSFNWISGYEINGVSNIIIFASGYGIELTFFFDSNNRFKSRSKVKIYLVSKDVGKFTRPKSIKNLKGILYILFFA